MNIPKIETERLILREHKLQDFPHCKEMWADEIITRHTIGKPSSEQQTWFRVLNYRGHWTLMDYGYWAIEEKKSQKYIGELGFADFKREIAPPLSGVPEMGWVLAAPFHRKGYAKEAIAAALNWGNENLASRTIACIINPGNLPSIKIAKDFGFQWKQDTTYLGATIQLFFRNFKVGEVGDHVKKPMGLHTQITS